MQITQDVDDKGNVSEPMLEALIKVGDSVETRAGPGKVLQVAGSKYLIKLSRNSDFPNQVYEYNKEDIQKI